MSLAVEVVSDGLSRRTPRADDSEFALSLFARHQQPHGGPRAWDVDRVARSRAQLVHDARLTWWQGAGHQTG